MPNKHYRQIPLGRVAILLSVLLHTSLLLIACDTPQVERSHAQAIPMQVQVLPARQPEAPPASPASPRAALPQQLKATQATAPTKRIRAVSASAPARTVASASQTLAATPTALTRPTAPDAPVSAVAHQAVSAAQVDTAQATQYLSNPAPAYPLQSRRLGEQGRVLLQVSVRENGNVAAVRLIQSSGFTRLDEAARQAVLRWRFHPAQKNGVAIADEVTIPMPFRLKAETPEQ